MTWDWLRDTAWFWTEYHRPQSGPGWYAATNTFHDRYFIGAAYWDGEKWLWGNPVNFIPVKFEESHLARDFAYLHDCEM
jgi:hypothetical protein